MDSYFVEQLLQAADCDVYSEWGFLLGLFVAGLGGYYRVSEELGFLQDDCLLVFIWDHPVIYCLQFIKSTFDAFGEAVGNAAQDSAALDLRLIGLSYHIVTGIKGGLSLHTTPFHKNGAICPGLRAL